MWIYVFFGMWALMERKKLVKIEVHKFKFFHIETVNVFFLNDFLFIWILRKQVLKVSKKTMRVDFSVILISYFQQFDLKNKHVVAKSQSSHRSWPHKFNCPSYFSSPPRKFTSISICHASNGLQFDWNLMKHFASRSKSPTRVEKKRTKSLRNPI